MKIVGLVHKKRAIFFLFCFGYFTMGVEREPVYDHNNNNDDDQSDKTPLILQLRGRKATG